MAFTFDAALSYVSVQEPIAARLSSALRSRGLHVLLGIKDHAGEVFFAGEELPGQEEQPWWDAPGRIPLNGPVTVVGDIADLVDNSGTLHAIGLPSAGNRAADPPGAGA